MPTRILCLGGGSGGLTAASELNRALGERVAVTVIDREPRFYMGLTKLWVATGKRKAEECMHARALLSRQGVGFVCEEIRRIDVTTREVETGARRIAYDHLVIALGLEVVPEAVPGLLEHGLNLYRMSGAEQVAEALKTFPGGDLLIAVCGTPFKCPPAPYEASMLIEDLLRLRGVRDKTRIEVATPEPRPLPTLPPEIGGGVQKLLSERSITFTGQTKITRVEPGKAVFENGVEERFDLLIAVPPHRPPVLLKQTPDLTDESGLAVVEPATLATRHPNVYAVGDCAKVLTHAGTPIPRAGMLAEAQARVVAANLIAQLSGKTGSATFDGRGFCFLEVGGNLALKVEGEFFAQPGPAAKLSGAACHEDFRSKQAFEQERLRAWFG